MMTTRQPSARQSDRAFTLIELLVVIAVIAILASLLLPALAGAKKRTQRIKCTSQMKQLGIGFTLFAGDHLDCYPLSAYSTGAYQYQLAWDDYIHRFIGGTASDADLMVGISGGISPPSSIPKILRCPADTIEISISWATYGQRRTYAMAYADTVALGAPLPPPTHGPGVYMSTQNGTLPDWEARGYATSVCQDPAGSLLLVEQPEGGNIAGNDYPSFCMGPTGPADPGGSEQTPYQIVRGGQKTWGGDNLWAPRQSIQLLISGRPCLDL